jgi:TPR repeat protein
MAKSLNKWILALGLVVLICIGCKQSNSKVVTDFTQMTFAEVKAAADRGDPRAQFELGQRFYAGKGILKDSEAAVEWWQKSAAQKFPPAELDWGLAYLKGDGVPKDERKGLRLCHLAVDSGLPRAKEAMGMFYFLGAFGFPQDCTQAFYCFKAAADHDYPPAQYYLALCFRDGKGTPTNLSEAVSWLQRAASNGVPNAQAVLGHYYFDKGFAELGIPNQNFVLGAEWYRKAANQGYLPGQMALVFAYGNGAGVAKDPIEAYKWFALSSIKYPPKMWKTNGIVFTPEQISAGKLRAEEFSKTNQISPKSVDEILGL